MPVGSVVAGSKKFIEDFRDNQYMMGGCFQKIGMFAAMGLVSLREVRFDLKKDHEMGTLLGKKM